MTPAPQADTRLMGSFAVIPAARRIVAPLCACLLAGASSVGAAPDPCAATVTEVRLPTTRPSRCIAVHLERATIVLDMSLVRAHAFGTTQSHPGDPHRSRWDTLRAGELLQQASTAAAGGDCASIDASSPTDLWHYVGLQIDRGHAVVYPVGSDQAVPYVSVRNRPICGSELGATGTRVYLLPGWRWLLPLITAIA